MGKKIKKHWTSINKCEFCKQSFAKVEKTREHIIPQSKIHKNHILNYTASCFTCNQLKDNKNAKEFALFLENIKKEINNTKDWKIIIKYSQIKPYINIMINNAWKLYNKTHKSHKNYLKFIEKIKK